MNEKTPSSQTRAAMTEAIRLVAADKFHVDDLQLVRDGCDQPVVIAFDVEDHVGIGWKRWGA